MEKNWNSRSSLSQAKTQNIDAKKSQDASASKPWPRSSKKRESPSNGSSRSDPNRKPPPQKGKSFDKRPKPRGAYCGGAMGGKSDPRLEEQSAEVGSVFLPGSKKQNLNHLLNFQFSSRSAAAQGMGAAPRRPHGLVYSNTHKHSKELFLQSNCQFVVKSDGNYVAHLVDPDVPVNWDLVEQINVRVSEVLSCPICLGEVVAGRITRCGHSYCWPCLLHYFALSEEPQRPCPICFQPIDKRHLRSVQGVWQDTIPASGELHMRLMRRAQGSTLVEPAPQLDEGEEESCHREAALLSVSERELSTLFSKLLTANPQEVMDIINRERAELSNQLSVESDNPEYCFIQDALNQLQNRESKLLAAQGASMTEPPKLIQQFTPNSGNDSGGLSFIDLMEELVLTKPLDTPDLAAKDLGLNPDAPVFNLKPAAEETGLTEPVDGSASSDGDCSITTSSVLPLKDDKKSKFFYFYQASDGQAVFLEGLEVRLLEASWRTLAHAPRRITSRVLRRTSGSVGQEARRRLRCLRHLPIHCPYDLVQLDLKPPHVLPGVLASFKGELDERKRQMARKVRSERRREREISQHEEALMGRGGPGLRLSLESQEHFPCYQPEDSLAEHHFPAAAAHLHLHHLEEEDDSPTSSSSISESCSNLSFAKMASGSGTWRSHQPVPAPSAPARGRRDSEGSEGEGAMAPAYHVSLSEAIAAAMRSGPQLPASKQGKKKKKAQLLFSTGIQHHH